jgi:predicted N-acetyltransferase YhbS
MKLVIKQESKTDFKEVYNINKLAFREESEVKLFAIVNSKIVDHILFTKSKYY